MVLIDSPALGTIYREAYPVMVEQGVPLHVTLLYPFVPPQELPDALSRLGAVVADHEPFDFQLTELRTFIPGVHIWLAPEPGAPFGALTAAIEEAFPEHPPYGGEIADVVHHATLARVDEDELDESLAQLGARVGPLLPMRLTAEEVAVLAEDGDGQWSVRARLPLGFSAWNVPTPG